ncbi:hypothetical protein [Nocardia anaemiae]|nr:hypothetical protein [Nocardia anaemiae]
MLEPVSGPDRRLLYKTPDYQLIEIDSFAMAMLSIIAQKSIKH